MSPIRTVSLVVVTSLLSTGCLSRRTIATVVDGYGWWRVDASGPPAENALNAQRLTPIPLGPSSPTCDVLRINASEDPATPVLVFVHGISGGGGPEWDNAFSILMRARPSAAFMFRWVAYEERDQVVQQLATGVSRIAQCTRRRVLVLAHSAGGVLASYASSQFAVPADGQVDVVTVASPLAGTLDRKPSDTGEAQLFFLFDLGTRIREYPDAADHVKVWHLRTFFPADHVMKAGRDGVSPNELNAGVPSATRISLPSELSHVAALTYVAERMAREGWLAWLETGPIDRWALRPPSESGLKAPIRLSPIRVLSPGDSRS